MQGRLWDDADMGSAEICVYCHAAQATVRDHVVPVLYASRRPRRSKGERGETVPACRRCNALLSSKLFATFEERRAYVKQRRIAEGSWVEDDFDELPPKRLPSEVRDSL